MGTLGGDVSLIIRVMPGGEEAEVEMPLTTTGSELKSALSESGLLEPQTPYSIMSKGAGVEIGDGQSLAQCGVQINDTLLVSPSIVAG